MITNGFPYKSASQLGVENDLDAYVATKQAVYGVLYDRDVRSFYHGGDYRGELIVNAIDKMVNEGRYGSQTPASANLSINKVGNLQEETAYYSQEYKVSSTVRLDRYDVTSTVGLPDGSYIADVNGTHKTNFGGTEHFKVMIPKNKMVADISSMVFVQAKCETYPIFYRKIAKF